MTTSSNFVLNRLFTQNTFFELIENTDNKLYSNVINRYISEPESKNNGEIISEIYKVMADDYRNEYFYKNTLLNKLLLEKHNPENTTALTEIPINNSKADFVLINGKGIVYEIKTDLDNFERLDAQISDYYQAFSHVCVVISPKSIEKTCRLIAETTGILVLNKDTSIDTIREPLETTDKIDPYVMFKVLHKREFENIIKQYYGFLPNSKPVFYFDACSEMFVSIPLNILHKIFLAELKQRNRIMSKSFENVPKELKFLAYFSHFSTKEYDKLIDFLSK